VEELKRIAARGPPEEQLASDERADPKAGVLAAELGIGVQTVAKHRARAQEDGDRQRH